MVTLTDQDRELVAHLRRKAVRGSWSATATVTVALIDRLVAELQRHHSLDAHRTAVAAAIAATVEKARADLTEIRKRAEAEIQADARQLPLL